MWGNNYKKVAVVSACIGSTVTLTEPVELQYQYGYIEHGDNIYHVDAQIDSRTLVLLHSVDLNRGDDIRLVKGCDGSMKTCHHVFNNAINYGGAEYLPLKNPYVGDPINR